MKIVLVMLMSMSAQAGWWQDVCERHLIADDPYQYEGWSVDQINIEYRLRAEKRKPLRWLDREIKHRLNGDLSLDDRIILLTLIGIGGRQ